MTNQSLWLADKARADRRMPVGRQRDSWRQCRGRQTAAPAHCRLVDLTFTRHTLMYAMAPTTIIHLYIYIFIFYLAPKTWNNRPLEIRLSSTYHLQNAAQEVSFHLAFHFTAPSSPPSDCRRLRFSLLAEIVRLINSHIIIIIIAYLTL